MIRMNWCRNVINRNVAQLKHVFKWATENELIPPSVYHGLSAVAGLRKGHGGVRETKPVQPMPEEDFGATLPHLSRPPAGNGEAPEADGHALVRVVCHDDRRN